MNAPYVRKGRAGRGLTDRRRAVIDIGSNTVRLVMYDGPARAPDVIWNEKVTARLGRNMAGNGAIPPAAEKEALGALARYALLVRDLEIEDVQTVATAATRDADNGPAFLRKVAALGLVPRQLSGEEEARAAAMGATGAFPGAQGVVADLGGGSLELVSVEDGECHHGASLPLGTLRLSALRKKGGFGKNVRKALGSVGWAQAHPGPLFMVGGTWRALASYAMHETGYPLTDPHGFVLQAQEAERLCRRLVRSKPERLAEMGGISAMRAGHLPDAAALLQCMIDELEPTSLVFSSWGLREGLLFDRLDTVQRAQDPLLAGIIAFAEPRGASITDATRLVGWTVELANGAGQPNERLRLAAAMLATALQRVEPNLRVNHATEWALDKRWIGCDARARAMICAALLGSLGKTALPESFRLLASDDDLREGVTWGLGFRLARRLGGASRISMSSSALTRGRKALTLRLDESRAALAHYPLTQDVEVLAAWLGLEARIKIGSVQSLLPDALAMLPDD